MIEASPHGFRGLKRAVQTPTLATGRPRTPPCCHGNEFIRGHHFSIGIPLNHSHGLRCGEMIFIGGLHLPDRDPDDTIARLASEMVGVVSKFENPTTGEPVHLRIGLHASAVVAGVIGNRKFAYDLWGDAVNVAARMEATGEVGRIQVPEAFAASLQDRFAFEPRGEVEIKGKGRMKTLFLTGRCGPKRSEFAVRFHRTGR